MKTVNPAFLSEISHNLEKSSQFIQVILGPRQVGKTTGILRFLRDLKKNSIYSSADDELSPTSAWFEQKWQEAVLKSTSCILVIDEIQKIPQWSSVVKKLWDAQKRNKKSRIQLVLLGSSSLQIQQGLQESLTGRFQLIRATHWDFERSRQLAKLDVETFITHGGYPGSYDLLPQPTQWTKYIRDSIVETVIGKDILQIARVDKPALFRQSFSLLTSYPAQEISYTKLLGQLQDTGNTDLVKHYIELFEGAFLIKTLQKYSGRALVKRSSSPKIIPLCGALIDRDVIASSDGHGRAFEAAVGAALLNNDFAVSYWRDGNDEVDYVTSFENQIVALEVKSGRTKSRRGLDAFARLYKGTHAVFVTEENIEKFLVDPRAFFGSLIG